MPALSYDVKSGFACTNQPDTGYYYGYFHQRTGGQGLQRSVTHYLGTGLAADVADSHDNLLSYATVAFEKASRPQRALIAAIAVVKLCTSEDHRAELHDITTGPRVERVVMAGIVKPGGRRVDYQPARLFSTKKEVDRYPIPGTDQAVDNVLSAPLTLLEKSHIPVICLREARPSELSPKKSAFLALRGLSNEIIVETDAFLPDTLRLVAPDAT